MANRLTSKRAKSSPEWLRGRWDQQRRETADRVGRAVARLRAQDQPVTFSAIRDAVKHIDGVSISTNTIQRTIWRMPSISSTRQSGHRTGAGIDRCPRCWTTPQPRSVLRCTRRLLGSAVPQKTN